MAALKASQRKKRGKPWRKPKASEGGRSGPHDPPDFDGSLESRDPSGGRSSQPSGGHFLFRGMQAPPPAKRQARRAEWPQGFPPDSFIRMWRARNMAKVAEPPKR